MATEAELPRSGEIGLGVHDWANGIVAGILASVAFGVMMGKR